jgi:hypothetical protein
MSSRTKMMGAGNAGMSVYNVNTNLNTFGGSKKQGITSRVGLDPWANTAVQTYSNGYGRNKLFVINQLGGVGAGQSMFNRRFTQVDGVHGYRNPPYYVKKNNGVNSKMIRLVNIFKSYAPYVVPSDRYMLSLVGDKETFKQDLIDAGFPELADEAHAKIIHLDNNYAVPDMPNQSEAQTLITYLNNLIKTQVPSVTNGITFGTHTLALVPISTATSLYDANYGHSRWNLARVFNSSSSTLLISSPVFDITVGTILISLLAV